MNTILSMPTLAPALVFCSVPLEPSLSSSRSSALPPSLGLVGFPRSNCDQLRFHRHCDPHSWYDHWCWCRWWYYCLWPSGCNVAAAAVAQRLEPGPEPVHADGLLDEGAVVDGALADDVPRKDRSGTDAGERRRGLTGAFLRQESDTVQE